MKIQFPARAVVIKQVQQALGLNSDGRDGRDTWQAIAEKLPLTPIPRFTRAEFANPKFREAIVSRVQRSLGNILIDGHDGQETWSALAERFDPILGTPAHPPTGHYIERVRGRTPNRNNGTNSCDGLVIHHASGYFEGTVSWCLQPKTFAGYHVLIATNGERAILAQDTDRTHHAGESVWKGRSGCNAFMLGLAFTGNTNDGAMRGVAGKNLTKEEIASAIEWINPRMKKYGWTKADITSHRQVSPGRKDDTSEFALKQILNALP